MARDPAGPGGSAAAGMSTCDFAARLEAEGLGHLTRDRVSTLQLNIGRRCNSACQHCHVEASPERAEAMDLRAAERVIELLARHPQVALLDITGGAPELNPNFRFLVQAARRLGRRVIDRCNLSVLLLPGQADTACFLADQGVEVVASLPCYTAENVDAQRGRGAFDRSVEALHKLNQLGYGRPGSPLRLDLVYNPLGAFLPPAQAELEAQYRDELRRRFGIEFNRLLTITNMPIHRFADDLKRQGRHAEYLTLLVDHFNPAAVPELMCREMVSVSWDGRLYDCDFNQSLEIDIPGPASSIWDIEELAKLSGRPIATGSHCFGCTAGAGSSCGGSLTPGPRGK